MNWKSFVWKENHLPKLHFWVPALTFQGFKQKWIGPALQRTPQKATKPSFSGSLIEFVYGFIWHLLGFRTRCWFERFCLCSLFFVEDEPILTNIFQMGLFPCVSTTNCQRNSFPLPGLRCRQLVFFLLVKRMSHSDDVVARNGDCSSSVLASKV